MSGYGLHLADQRDAQTLEALHFADGAGRANGTHCLATAEKA